MQPSRFALLGKLRRAAYGAYARVDAQRVGANCGYAPCLESVAKRGLMRALALRPTTAHPHSLRASAPVSSIDAVYTWIDPSDPAWQRDKARWIGVSTWPDASTINRFADRDELLYSLRSLEANMPWIRHVYLVTRGHRPAWLRTAHPRLRLVDHRTLFEDASHLPTFNSAAIEAHLWRIEGLSEHFVYMNDDVFVSRPLHQHDLIEADGTVRVVLDHPVRERDETGCVVAAMQVRSREAFERRVGALPAPDRVAYHGPVVHRRSVHAELARIFRAELEATSASRFRTPDCLALVQLVYPQFVLREGLAREVEIPWVHFAWVGEAKKNRASLRLARHLPADVIAVSDHHLVPAPAEDERLRGFLHALFPKPSSFEI